MCPIPSEFFAMRHAFGPHWGYFCLTIKIVISFSYLFCRVVLPAFFAWGFLTATNAGPLNDTGIDFGSGLEAVTDSGADFNSGGPSDPMGAQDARYGRDAAANLHALQKKGGSAGTRAGRPNGFDFTKVSNVGAMLGEDAELGSNPNDWACTLDNTTGLMWEIKVADQAHLRYVGHTYTWYRGGRLEGELADGGVCHASGRCDTDGYLVDVSKVGMCGHYDWRLPTPLELVSIVDRGRHGPAIDPVYFPNTPGAIYWTASVVSGLRGIAWGRNFENGAGAFELMEQPRHVRLVRGAR